MKNIDKPCCMSLELLSEHNKHPTYMICIRDNFTDMKNSGETVFLENATIHRSDDDWFVVEGDVMKSQTLYASGEYNKEYIKDFRDHERIFYNNPYKNTDDNYTPRQSHAWLVETSRERFTFKYGIFREFLDL